MDTKAGVITGVAVGIGVGSALMYWYDPSAGKRRRADMRYEARRVVKQIQKTGKQMQKTIDRTANDLEKISRMRVVDVAEALVPKKARALILR